jgi:catabolite regulation protein CreA
MTTMKEVAFRLDEDYIAGLSYLEWSFDRSYLIVSCRQVGPVSFRRIS